MPQDDKIFPEISLWRFSRRRNADKTLYKRKLEPGTVIWLKIHDSACQTFGYLDFSYVMIMNIICSKSVNTFWHSHAFATILCTKANCSLTIFDFSKMEICQHTYEKINTTAESSDKIENIFGYISQQRWLFKKRFVDFSSLLIAICGANMKQYLSTHLKT